MILQPVKTFDYEGASRYTGYLDKSIRLILECGHEQVRKASQGVPKRARCIECERKDLSCRKGKTDAWRERV